MRRLALVALAGCGRLGFEDGVLPDDAPRDDAPDPEPDAPPGCTVHHFVTAPPGYEEFGGGTVSYTGRLEVGIPGGQNIDAGLRMTTPGSFVNREVAIQVVKVLDSPSGLTSFGWHDVANGHSTHLFVSNDELILERFTPPDVYQMPNRIPYVPAQHRWWQIRDAGGVIRMYTSPDGATWALFGAVPAFPTMTQVIADFGADSPFTSIPADTAVFDDVVDCAP